MPPDGNAPGTSPPILPPVFTREAVLGGMPAKRASTLLFAIENRTALLTSRARRAMSRCETEHSTAEREALFFGALADGRTLPLKPTIQDLDRHAAEWRDLVPEDAALRAALLARIATKYGLPAQARNLASALGAADPRVVAEYERQASAATAARAGATAAASTPADSPRAAASAGASLAALATAPLPLRERLRWRLDRLSRRVEALPPFWLAYTLTLTETVGVGVLALPIALAGFGAAGAALVLVAFGLVSTLTLTALVESITRTGNMRYGHAFFGRLIGDYLGRPGNAAAMPVLFGLEAATFVVCVVGLATTLASVTGLPVLGWAGALFVANLVILWRDSLDITVAFAVLLGLTNLVLLLGMAAIAFLTPGPGGAGTAAAPSGAGFLELIFGVALGAYFGHTSAGYSAKVVLARDPSGNQFLAGNVAAMLSAVVIYVAFVLGVSAAVGPDLLRGSTGTALVPLADRAGPAIDVMGSLYVLFTMGLGSMFSARSIYNLTGELLHARTSLLARVAKLRKAGEFAIRVAPVALIFAAVAVMLATSSISMTGLLALIGTLTAPLLGGVIPMLILLSARRRGERVPGRFLAPLGNPVIASVIGLTYLGGVAAFGLWIWTAPLDRIAAIAICVAMVLLAVLSIRRGALRPRTVVEYRVESGPPALGVVSVVSAGRSVGATVHVREGAAVRDLAGPDAEISTPGRVRQIGVDLPASVAPEILVWLHAVGADGASAPAATPIDVAIGDGAPVRVTGTVDHVEMPSTGEPQTLTLSMSSST